MKKVLLILAAAALLMPATGCVSLFYSHESEVNGVTRREAGLLGVSFWNHDRLAHGLLPVYFETHRKGVAPAPDDTL
jgi:hypothetical protein